MFETGKLHGRTGAGRRAAAIAAAVVVAAGLALVASPAQAVVDTIRVTGTSMLVGSESVKTATALCPGSRKLVGAGANVNNGGGHVVINEIVPNGASNINPTAVTARAVEDQSGTSNSWTLSVYAICTSLPFLSHFQYFSQSPPLTSGPETSVTVSCYGSMSLLGVGFDIEMGNGQVNGLMRLSS